jgi:hypothetical protein
MHMFDAYLGCNSTNPRMWIEIEGLLVMSMKLWNFGYEIYHGDVLLASDIIDLLRHTFGTCL